MVTRDEEFAAAGSAAEVEMLQRRWRAEDAAAAAEKSAEGQRIRSLEARVRQLEQAQRTLLTTIAEATGEVLADRELAILAEVDQRITERSLSYEGIHDPGRSYAKNAIVTASGSLWLCVDAVAAGELPGKSHKMRLIAKSGSSA